MKHSERTNQKKNFPSPGSEKRCQAAGSATIVLFSWFRSRVDHTFPVNVPLRQGALGEFCVKIRVVSISESLWVIESRKWVSLIARVSSRGSAPTL